MIDSVGSTSIVGGVVNKEKVSGTDNATLREKVERLSSRDKQWVARLCASLSRTCP